MFNKLEIIIKDEPQSDDKKTAAFPRRRPQQLGRRRTGGIRFYDCGSVWDATDYISLPYLDSVQALSLTYTSIGGLNNVRSTMTAGEYLSLRDSLIFAYPRNEWKQTFRQLVPDITSIVYSTGALTIIDGDLYNLTTASDYWSSDGVFRATSGDEFEFGFPFFCESFQVHNSKVTATYDYSASAVSGFRVKSTADIFLFPQLFMAQATTTRILTGTGIGSSQAIDGGGTIAPRESFWDASDEFFGRLDGWSSNPVWDMGSGSYTLTFDLAQWVKERQAIRGTEATIAAGTWTDIGPIDVTDFGDGFTSSPPTTTGYATYRIEGVTIPLTSFATPPRLAAVIRQGGQDFYVWLD